MGLRTCEEHDSVVVYEGRDCPVCTLKKERDELEGERDSLKVERDELGDRVEELETEVEDLRERVENLQRRILTEELKQLEGGKS